jgi:catechol 2,3-dioxygenase-like lactoylglutathione lyase family enzyme
MKLYFHPVSTTSRPILLLAADEGIVLEPQIVDLFKGEHRQAPYLAINPSGQVPTLEDGDFRLTEGSAILKYLAEKSDSRAYQHDFDLHIALEVDEATLHAMFDKGKAAGMDTRGISDHGFVRSIYFRDQNGYVIELTAKTPDHDASMERAKSAARAKLDNWQKTKRAA